MHRRALAALSAVGLMLGLAGLGVVSTPSWAVGEPIIHTVTPNPAALVYKADSPIGQSTEVRVTVDRAQYTFVSAFVTDFTCGDPFGTTCPAYEIPSANPTRVGGDDVIQLNGSVPNTHADNSLIRSDQPGTTSVRVWVVYKQIVGGGQYATAGPAFAAFSDQRVRIDAPNTIEQGAPLTVKAVSEAFNRAWVSKAAALQLQFKPDGGSAFANQGAPVQTGQDGNAVFTVPAVGSSGNWQVTTTAPPGARTVVSNQVHVAIATTPPPPVPVPPTPSAPIVTFNKASTTSLFFNISAPAVGSPIDHYEWTWTPADGGGSATSQPGVSPFEIGGLKPGTHYDVSIRAVNSVGPGETANTSGDTVVVPPAVNPPGVPRHVKGSAGNHKATITWRAPKSTGGAPITRYVVHRFGKNKTVGADGRSVTFKHLKNNATYTLFVKACNAAGCGAFSGGVQVRPPG